MAQSKFTMTVSNIVQSLFRSYFLSFAALFVLMIAAPLFSQEENVKQISSMRDGLREEYSDADFQNFLLREKLGQIPFQGGIVDQQAATDALVNNNTGTNGTAYFTQSETDIIAFGNSVLIGFNDSGSYGTGGSKFTGFSLSTDGGTSWVDGGTLPTNSGGDAGDPVFGYNETTGRIYFSTLGFNVSTIQVFRSDDGGVTWMPPVNGTPGGSSEDKQWITVDNYGGAGNGNVYLISRRFGGPQGIYMFRSTDHGNTFTPNGGVQIFGGGQGAYVAVGPDHSVYAFYYNGTSSIQVRKSTDFGASFGTAVNVVTGLTGGTNGDMNLTGLRQGTASYSYFRSNSFPHVAVNPVSGHLYCTFNDNPVGTDKADIYMVMSTDGGATWSARTQINDDGTTTDQWQPTIAVTPNGNRIGIFYYSRQEDPVDNNLFKFYGRIGSISGSVVTFEPGFAISDVASLPEFGRDNVVNSVYMGDYTHAYATNSDFHLVWSDNRDDLPGGAPRKDPNVYYEKITLGPPCPITPASNPSPANGATGLALTGNSLGWTNGTGANQIEIWFGEYGNLNMVYDGAPVTTYSLASFEPLTYNTTYGWQIRGKNDSCSVPGPLWTFTTMSDPNLFQYCEEFNDLSNWTVIGPLGTTNWSAANQSTAGGNPPELQMNWTPSFTGVSTVRSDAIALPNNQTVGYSFRFYLDWYANPSGAVSVDLTYDDGATLSNIYTVTDPTSSVGPLLLSGTFTTPGSGAANTKVQITYNGYSFNINWIAFDDMCLEYVVPVELTSFTAEARGTDVELSWTTATETNNQGFEVERMKAGSTYEQIGYVAGFGTTTEPKAYSFIDTELGEGNYTYRIKQIDFDGSYTYSDEVEVVVEIPLEYALEQNYPNPFNPSTTIKYSLADDGFVKLAVYNMLGEEVATIVNGTQKAGRYEVVFDASQMSSGVYVYRIETGNFVSSKKLMLLK